jgi:hypothetical protein
VDVLNLQSPFSLGIGTTEVFTVGNPGAGNVGSRSVGSGYLERITAMTLVLTTSAVVANRILALVYQNQDQQELVASVAGFAVTASQAVTFGAAVGFNTTAAVSGTRGQIALPSLFMYPGWRLLLTWSNADGGDSLTSIRGIIERFPIGRDGYLIGEPVEYRRGRENGHLRPRTQELV